MIFGIGCDIVKIERFVSSCENQDFIKRYFSVEEIKAQEKKCKSVLQKAEYYAGRFACKEAFSKALGTGVRNFDLADISVCAKTLAVKNIKIKINIFLILFSCI